MNPPEIVSWTNLCRTSKFYVFWLYSEEVLNLNSNTISPDNVLLFDVVNVQKMQFFNPINN